MPKKLSTTKIGATEGKFIAEAKDVFSWVDPDFKNYGTASDVETSSCEKTIEVYEQEKDGTLKEIFSEVHGPDYDGQGFNKMCLTQGQIIDIVKNHSEILKDDGYGTFFLFKENNEFFVADVDRDGGGWGVGVGRLSGGGVYRAGCRLRVVVSKLTPEKSSPLTLGDSDTLTLSHQDSIDKAIAFLKGCGFTITKTF